MLAAIMAIEYHLPEKVLTNRELATLYSDWSVDKIESKTGMDKRHIADDNECASDLGIAAPIKLFDSGVCNNDLIDYLLLCLQSHEKSGKTKEQTDLFIFHQANLDTLEHFPRKQGIPAENFFIGMQRCGNTVSSTTPIALRDAVKLGHLRTGMTVMLVGFGVGCSWCATLGNWSN